MKRKVLLLVPLLFVLVGGTLILLDINKSITIILDEESRTLNTWALRVEDVLQTENISLRQDDLLDPPAQTWLQEGDTIVIQRASQVEQDCSSHAALPALSRMVARSCRSCSSSTVRGSSTSRSASMRAMIGGSAARSAAAS